MKIKEVVIKSLSDIKKPSTYKEIYNLIARKKYYNFGQGKTPEYTVSGTLSDFIKNKDIRVKRIGEAGKYLYYLAEYENTISFEESMQDTETSIQEIKTEASGSKKYKEKDLHKLLSSYLNYHKIYSTTIPHTKSINKKDGKQKWTHPDMVGVKFLNLDSKINKAFMKTVNNVDTFSLTSYELKREIKGDSGLKDAYFQAVSNSSWSNYGYLVAFEIGDNLENEMERLNKSFGIGIIHLKCNPFESEILFQAKFRELDFKTIDKLCVANKKYETFIDYIQRLLAEEEKNCTLIEKDLNEFSDDYFTIDSEIEEYCKTKKIPCIDDKDILE